MQPAESQRPGQFRPVRPLTGFHLDQLLDLEPSGSLQIASDCLPLGVQTEAAAPLFLGRNTQITYKFTHPVKSFLVTHLGMRNVYSVTGETEEIFRDFRPGTKLVSGPIRERRCPARFPAIEPPACGDNSPPEAPSKAG